MYITYVNLKEKSVEKGRERELDFQKNFKYSQFIQIKTKRGEESVFVTGDGTQNLNLKSST